MKSAGLSSKFKKTFRETTKMTAFASEQNFHMGAKQKQIALRVQAAKAQFERQKREALLLAEKSDSQKDL